MHPSKIKLWTSAWTIPIIFTKLIINFTKTNRFLPRQILIITIRRIKITLVYSIDPISWLKHSKNYKNIYRLIKYIMKQYKKYQLMNYHVINFIIVFYINLIKKHLNWLFNLNLNLYLLLLVLFCRLKLI